MAELYSDSNLLPLIARADTGAFGYLYKKHFLMVRNLVEKNSGTPDDASDLFQEVLIIVYEKVRDNKLRLTCSLKTYIYSVARNQWLKKLSEQKRYPVFRNFEDYVHVEEEEDHKPEFEMKDLLSEIGEACRKLLILFYYRKKSMQEICVELDYANADTAKNQKYKCLQRLRKLVENKN